jgi:uncharacterized protein YjbJ (UPF0337 family)
MNWDHIAGRWTEFKGKVRERWGKLTDDDLDRIRGRKDQLMGILQQRYGWAREHAQLQIADFEDSLRAFASSLSGYGDEPDAGDEDPGESPETVPSERSHPRRR